MNLIVLGAGLFAREVADLAADLGWNVAGFVVDVPGQPGELDGKPVWAGPIPGPVEASFVAGFLSPERRRMAEWLQGQGFEFAALVHPSASVSRAAEVYPGAVVGRCVAVSRSAVLSFCSIVNRGATIGHDVLLGPWSTIGPGANLAGGVRVGMQATVGMGANVLEGRAVGANSVVGAGAVVTRDVPPGETWLGAPARRVR